MVAGRAVTPVKMGAAAITGSRRISIATLDTEVTNLSQAAKQYPGVVNLPPSQRPQSTLSWLIRYQISGVPPDTSAEPGRFVAAPVTVTRPQGPTASASPVGTAPAC